MKAAAVIFGALFLVLSVADGTTWYSVTCLVLAIFFAAVLLGYRHLIESYLGRIDTKEACAAVLAKVLNYQNVDQTNDRNLYVCLCDMYPDFRLLNFFRDWVPLQDVLRLDESAQLHLLVKKSTEYRLLTPLNPQLTYPGDYKWYKVEFEPKLFECMQ